MKIRLFKNVTPLDAVKDMISKIDNSNFDEQHVVIVPDRFSLLSERLLLQLLPSKALFNVRVTTLTNFSLELLEKLGVKVNEVLSSGEALLLTQKAIENVKGELQTFKKSRIAFSYEISKVISQLKSSGVMPDDLNENAGGITGAKYHDLKIIYKEYQNLLAGKLDANERLSLLNSSFKEGELLMDTHLYFAGFDAFTKAGYTLIENLIDKAKSLNFSISSSFDVGNDYIYDKDISEKLRALSSEKECLIETFEGEKNFSEIKQNIVKGVYSYKKTNCENDGFYNLYSANNITEEVEAACKLIRYKVYKDGLKFNNIQIAVGNLERYQTQIENLFDRYDIPYYIDNSITADQTMLGRLVLDFLEGVSFGFSGDRLINLLSNVLLGENEELIERCQKIVIDSKLKYKKYIEKYFPFADIALSIEKCKRANEFKEKILEFVGRVLSSFDEVMRLLEERGDLKERNINLQAFDILKETLELIGKYDEEEVELDEFIRKLKLLLSFRQVSTVPTYVDGVMIGDGSASFFDESDTLIILGAQELPITSLDNGILSDEELGKNIKEIEPTIRMINRRNRFRCFSLLPLAKKQLIIFYQLMSEEGRKNELPTFISNLNDIFGQIELKAGNVFFARKALTADMALLGYDFKKNKHNFDENDEKCWKNREKLTYFPKNLMFKDNLVKVTQIENYFSCPFKHFANYGLKLGEVKSVEFDQRDIGNICHKGAELFIKALMKNGFNLDIDKEKFIETNLDKILKEEHLNEKLDLLDEKKSFIQYIKRQLKSNFDDITRELSKSKFRPKYIEKRFKNYKLSVDGEDFYLIGRADRIDEYKNYLRIIDYKTGKTESVLKQLYYGEKLQLFLYQKFAAQELNKTSVGGYYFNAKLEYASNEEEKAILKGVVPNDEELLFALDSDIENRGESGIFSIKKNKNGQYSGVCDIPMERLQDYAIKVTSEGIKEISEGFVKPLPCPNACTYCSLRSFCGYESAYGERKNKLESLNF